MIKNFIVLCAFIVLASTAKHPKFKNVEARPTSDSFHYDSLSDVDLEESESAQYGYGFGGRSGYGSLGSLGSLGRGFGSAFGHSGLGSLGRGLGSGFGGNRRLGNFGSLGGLGLRGGLSGFGGLGGRNFGLGRLL